MGVIENVRLRAGATLREWNEKRAEKRAQVKPDPAGVTVPEWLVRAAKFASWVATLSLMYFLWLYTLDIARDRAADLHVTRAGTWTGDVSFWFPYVVGFAIVAFGIPYVAKIAIPTFMSLDWRQNFWPKLWALIIALSVSLVVIAGTFAVQGDTLMERDREAAVAVETVQQGRAALEAQIEGKRQELADMMNNRNAYLAQAASVGAAEWERSYVTQARATNDPRLPMLERALGAARSADTLRGEIQALRTQLATSATVASVQGEVVTERTSWIADTLGWLEGVRAILLSLVMDIVALMMPWIALRLEQARARQLGVEASGWAPEGLRIEDLRDEAPVVPQPMRPAREVVTDADTGEELVRVKPREYWRKRKGQKQKLAIEPEVPPDERGVAQDGGGRIGSSVAGPIDVTAIMADTETNATNAAGRERERSPESETDEGENPIRNERDSDDRNAISLKTQPTPPEPEPEIDFDALIEPEPEAQQTEAEADEPQPDEAVEQDNAERDDVEPRGLLPAA